MNLGITRIRGPNNAVATTNATHEANGTAAGPTQIRAKMTRRDMGGPSTGRTFVGSIEAR